MQYSIKRGSNVIAEVNPRGTQQKVKMGANVVTMSFTLSAAVDFLIGDYVDVYAERYKLNSLPKATKKSSRRFIYNLEVQGKEYDAAKMQYNSLDENNELKQGDFVLMGTADTFIDLLVQNLNRSTEGGWKKGTVKTTEAKNLTFSGENCLSVLSRLAEEFETEFEIDKDGTVHLAKIENYSGFTFKYGQGEGLKSISRESVGNVFTRVSAYGGSKNIPGNYRNFSSRIKLSAPLEKNIDKYGEIEVTKIFDHIYPKRVGKITAVGDKFTFSDNTLDFDVNAQLIPDVSVKVVFQTGQLAGRKFEVKREGGYNHATKTFILLPSTDEKDVELPGDLLKPALGDEFILEDLIMPDSYVAAAELEVQIEGQKFLDANCEPKVKYGVEADPKAFKEEVVSIVKGDLVRLIDEDLSLDNLIRVVSVTRDINNFYKYSFELSDTLSPSAIVRSINKVNNLERAIIINDLTDVNKARANRINALELKNMIFDPEDGKYYTEKIKPEFIESLGALFGAQSQQFALSGVTLNPNYNSSATSVQISGGLLNHFTIDPAGIKTWILTGNTRTDLNPNTAYYIYARCDKTGSAGTFLFSTAQLKVSQDLNYYHFLLGILHSAVDGVRGVNFTFGQTLINGKFITTGRITSSDGKTYFDLDIGEFVGIFRFRRPDNSLVSIDSLLTDSISNFSNTLGDLALQDKVEQAMLGQSIFIGGYFRTELVDTAALIVRGSLETTAGAQAKANASLNAAQIFASGKAWQGGKMLYRDPAFATGFNGIATYNNLGNGTVLLDRIPAVFGGPSTSGVVLRIRNTGAASPGLGGFYFGTPTRANVVLTTRVIALIPIGGTIQWTSNAYGDGSDARWITPQLGTGKWEEYIFQLKCGSTGTFSSTNFFYLEGPSYGTSGSPVAWYVAYASVFDMTDAEVDYKALSDTAKSAADAAQSSANAANALLSDIASDSKLTPSEKQTVKTIWEGIMAEKPGINNQAAVYSITTENTNYNNSYTALSNYITPLLSSLSTTSDIVGNAFRAQFADYYNYRQLLLKAVTDKAKALADNAQTTANNAQSAATAAANAASTAQNSANAANALLSDIASDAKFSPVEKQSVKVIWDGIVAEKPTINNQAAVYSITTENTNYNTYYNALATYITSLLADLNSTSDIVRSTFEGHFSNYFTYRQYLLKAISDKAKQIADAAQTSANNAQSSANNAQASANAAAQAALAAQGTADVANSGLSSMAASLKAMAFQDVVEFSKLGSTIAIGGFLKTVLLNASEVRALVIRAEYIEALVCNFVQGIIGGFTISESELKGVNPSGAYLQLYSGQGGNPYIHFSDTGDSNTYMEHSGTAIRAVGRYRGSRAIPPFPTGSTNMYACLVVDMIADLNRNDTFKDDYAAIYAIAYELNSWAGYFEGGIKSTGRMDVGDRLWVRGMPSVFSTESGTGMTNKVAVYWDTVKKELFHA